LETEWVYLTIKPIHRELSARLKAFLNNRTKELDSTEFFGHFFSRKMAA
jgi:hypothetical protein